MTRFRFIKVLRKVFCQNAIGMVVVVFMAAHFLAVGVALYAEPAAAAVPNRITFFISPAGNDQNNGLSEEAPFKTFLTAFRMMAPGDELLLMDGTYSEEAGTGAISGWDHTRKSGGPHSEQIPSGLDRDHPTIVRAKNPGSVTVNGRLLIGTRTRKGQFIVVDGLTFVGGGHLYNAAYVTISNCGFHGAFGIGTNDHNGGNDFNLIEDVWIWAKGERIIAANYRSDHNVWRRVLVRGDGCGLDNCKGSGNPNVGITVYDSSHVSLQNVMVIDRILASTDQPYADFAVAQHTPGSHFFGKSEWLGTISLRSPDTGYYFEPDVGGTIDPTVRIQNAIAWEATYTGINLARAGTNNLIENVTVSSRRGDGIRIAPELTSGKLRNALVVAAGRYAINSKYPSAFVNALSAPGAAYNQTRCISGCYSFNPLSDRPGPSLKYLVRIESGSKLSRSGHRNGDIGANVEYRYGKIGSHYGEKDFNALTAIPLWPWPNENRIKNDMCKESGVTRGFCNAPSLTAYIWEYLGTPLPKKLFRGER